MSMLVSFVLSFFPRDVLDEILNLIGSVSEGFPSYSCISELLCLCCVEILKNLPVHSFNALIKPILRDCLPNNFLVGRPKAALLFWFFGDFRCGALLFMVIHVIYKYKNK